MGTATSSPSPSENIMSASVGRLGTIGAALPFLVLSLAPAAMDETKDPEPGVQIQTRGPVHEAYARPTALDAHPNPLVVEQPPELIPEALPEQKPEGPNVQWIPGYWAWDPEKKEFLWSSGFWRLPPPGRKWVPGYWSLEENGWRWVDGFWAPAGQDELEYLPPPPTSLELGPGLPPAEENSQYVPGAWIYRSAAYIWRPGYWLASRLGWLWHAAQYFWTPRGYVFVDGYWDRRLEERGLLFAPVSFDAALQRTPGWCYRPQCVVGPFGLTASLYVRPASCQYFFGDYATSSSTRWGIQPLLVYGQQSYDPLFSYYRWQAGNDPSWTRNLPGSGVIWTQQISARGSRPAAGQVLLPPTVGGPAAQIVTPLRQLRNGNLRLGELSVSQLMQQQAEAQRLRNLGQQRNQAESVITVFRVDPLNRGGSGAVGSLLPSAPGLSQPAAVAAPAGLPRTEEGMGAGARILSTTPAGRGLLDRTFIPGWQVGTVPAGNVPAVRMLPTQPKAPAARPTQTLPGAGRLGTAAPSALPRSLPPVQTQQPARARTPAPVQPRGGLAGPSNRGPSPGQRR